MCPLFCVCHQNKTLKKSSKIILFYQKISFFPQDFQIFVLPFSSLFPSLVISDFIEEVDWWYVLKFMLWHHHVTKLDFKKHRFFNIWWTEVLIVIPCHGQIWLSQGQTWSSILAGRQFHLLDVNHFTLSYMTQRSLRAFGFQILANHILRA